MDINKVEIDIATEAKWEGYHLGHLFMSLLKRNPDELNQIDAATGEKETNASVLSRSVRLAKCLRRLGLKPGDVMALSGRNHLDLHIPHYAALLNGLPLVAVDLFYKYDEVLRLFKIAQPKIAFCQHENLDDFQRAAKALNLATKVITFGEGECTLQKFMDSFDEDGSLEGFEPASFDQDKVYCWLIPTGGTTGTLKIAAFKHRTWVERALHYMNMSSQDGPKISWSKNLGLNISPVQWISGFVNAIGVTLLNRCKLQSSADHTTEHLIDIINEYKPIDGLMGPPLITSILNHEKKCDLTCFKTLTFSGGPIYKDILVRVKDMVSPDALVIVAYGYTESMGTVLFPIPVCRGPLGTCGRQSPYTKVKLVDPETEKEITEPNTPGELWTKGPRFTEYYNNPEQTAMVITEDGWYKTGDILYRDENDFYFFVDRHGMLMKYRSNQVIPVELEELIRTHPDVYDVGVTSIQHPEDGDLPVACVVRRPGSDVTADDIKALVAKNLSDSKQLRGGVVFLQELPLTTTGKLARMKLRQLMVDATKE